MNSAYRPRPTVDATEPIIDGISCRGRRPLGTWMTRWSHLYTTHPDSTSVTALWTDEDRAAPHHHSAD